MRKDIETAADCSIYCVNILNYSKRNYLLVLLYDRNVITQHWLIQ